MDFQIKLKQYKQIIDSKLEIFFDGIIAEVKDDSLRMSYNFMKEFVLNGGKRLRPIALIMAYNAVGGEDEKSIYLPSLSVELLHNSTLVHDDIMDEDELRRGKPTVYKRFQEWFLGNYGENNSKGSLFDNTSSRFAVSNAILNGNVLLDLGYSVLADSGIGDSGKAFSILNDSYRAIVDGQVMDIMTEFNKDISEEQYFDMISRKTADLFKASIHIGAVLGGANENQIENLLNYAVQAAIAFQIKDDIMDVSPDMNKGHELGSDIRQGKKNILVIKALELGSDVEKKKILEIVGKENASLDEINSLIEIFKLTGAIDYANTLSRRRIESAKNYLRKAEINEEGFEFFDKLADYMVERRV